MIADLVQNGAIPENASERNESQKQMILLREKKMAKSYQKTVNGFIQNDKTKKK